MRVWFHPEARIELLESIAYYGAQKRGLGERFQESVSEAIQRIRNHPRMYRQVVDEWRQCRVPRFPYGIIYRIYGRRIEINAVMHLSRKPGYWRNRAAEP
jgi:plasmid stabilization system protein ParE